MTKKFRHFEPTFSISPISTISSFQTSGIQLQYFSDLESLTFWQILHDGRHFEGIKAALTILLSERVQYFGNLLIKLCGALLNMTEKC